ncbi:hypothetical protein NGRA_2779 [Nosema granulosis]|uniref:MULE transposase domain-containing protein n=1 Tax=Nosema granulosis TaxID=83296 RepID=A0A9P6GX30_9MICR|nr:hypothetical protein NGRA_2779 [Nosema granulosis]
MDVTFKAELNEFYQLYIIHGEFNTQCYSLMYCLLKDKTEETYQHLFKTIKAILKRQVLQFYPATVQIVFEKADLFAITTVFPSAVTKECFFYFGKAVWRKVVDLGSKPMHNNNINFRVTVEMITAFSPVPLMKIDEA